MGEKLKRLTAYRTSQGYETAKAFAEFLGVSASQISEIDKKGKAANLLLALSQKTDINLEWLETGEGEMCVGVADVSADETAIQLHPEEQKRLEMMRELAPIQIEELDIHLHKLVAEKLMKDLKDIKRESRRSKPS